LRAAYEAEKPMLEAWGEFVVQTILRALAARLAPDRRVEYFVKLWPVAPRVKETKSFVAKALWRGKNYADPLAEITDKVGTRFVVLLLSDITVVESAITGYGGWNAELARDFAKERLEKPLYFDYQSLHYVVRTTSPQEINGIVVEEGISCEVQVRTLLQHAYSELAHDTIYKPRSILEAENPRLSREIARSMALIETTDMIFQEVARAIDKAASDLHDALDRASAVYRSKIGEPKAIDSRLAEFILAPFRGLVPLVTQADLEQVIEDRPHLAEFIRTSAAKSELFETSLILIILWLVEEDEDNLWRNWPVDRGVLEEIYAQLGISTEPY
jgi:ppGpp synthetase/RelA/SpoT-type nucleotidyltranferase